MIGLISNHLQTTLLTNGKYHPHLKRESFSEIIESSIFHNALNAMDADVEMVFYSEAKPDINIDRSKVQDAISQILGHAIQIAVKSTNIQIKLSENAHKALFKIETVTDKTDLFYLSHNWERHGYKSISKNLQPDIETTFPTIKDIIELNSGTLVVSRIENGIRFSIEFPLS